jgi:hypothetical protein
VVVDLQKPQNTITAITWPARARWSEPGYLSKQAEFHADNA